MIIITANSEKSDLDFVSRVFAPTAGIDEDPATGIAHCILGPLWAKKLKKQTLSAYQSSQRGAQFGLSLENNHIQLFGRARLVLKGNVVV
jgi:predicted PhzF superfamily epimerase YddE/YHI9